MRKRQKVNAGIGSFDVISVTEKFATERPDLLKAFLDATDDANSSWKCTDAEFNKVAAAAGMDLETTKTQIADFIMPANKE
jgi:taurine transport system substrate-binding protein